MFVMYNTLFYMAEQLHAEQWKS